MDTDSNGPETRGGRKAVKKAWKRTLDEMEQIAEIRKDEGWEAGTFFAVDTSPAYRGNEVGIKYILPDNHIGEFTELTEEKQFDDYVVYKNTVGAAVFIVLELIDEETDTIVLLAGQYDARRAKKLFNGAKKHGKIHTYISRLKGEDIRIIEHEQYKLFFPDEDPSS